MLPFSRKNNVISQEVIAVSPDERVILFKNIVKPEGLEAGWTAEELFLSGQNKSGDYQIISVGTLLAFAEEKKWGNDRNLSLAEAVAAGQYDVELYFDIKTLRKL